MLNSLITSPLQMLVVILVLTSAAIYAFAYLEREISTQRSFWKTIPIGIMTVGALILDGPLLLAVALLLCAIGDYFLSLDDDWFVAGLSAFLTGHIAYILLFASIGGGLEWQWATLFILMYSGFFARYLWSVVGKYRWPVLAYIIVITVMAAVSLTLPPVNFLVVAGAFIFVVSDSVLAIRMFVARNMIAKRTMSWIVWITYILGQSLIFIGIIEAS